MIANWTKRGKEVEMKNSVWIEDSEGVDVGEALQLTVEATEKLARFEKIDSSGLSIYD